MHTERHQVLQQHRRHLLLRQQLLKAANHHVVHVFVNTLSLSVWQLMWTFFSYLGTYLAGTEIPDKVVRQCSSPGQRVDALNARPIADVVIAVD